MTLVDRLHALCAKLGISPKVVDGLLVAVIAYVAYGLINGSFDLNALKVSIGLILLGAVGVAAPPAAGVKQEQVDRLAGQRPKRRHRAHLER